MAASQSWHGSDVSNDHFPCATSTRCQTTWFRTWTIARPSMKGGIQGDRGFRLAAAQDTTESAVVPRRTERWSVCSVSLTSPSGKRSQEGCSEDLDVGDVACVVGFEPLDPGDHVMTHG